MNDLWTYLEKSEKPIAIYGTGNGADKIINVLEERGIHPAAIFASDEFVRARDFRGYRVLSYKDVKERYGDVIILVSFGTTLAEVMDRIKHIADENELYLPDVPVVGEGLFDQKYFELHKSELEYARELFFDERSKAIFDDMVNFKLTGSLKYLNNVSTFEEITSEILHPNMWQVAVDSGAYRGDTAEEMLECAPNLRKIIAVEPDIKSCAKLRSLFEENGRVEVYNAAVWNEDTEIPFRSSGGRGARIEQREKDTVRAIALDNVLEEDMINYMKYDVEGAEYKAIEGSRKTISRHTPELCVAAYHRNEDLFELPKLIKDICSDYKLYLRRYDCFPAWELNIYAIM